MNRATIGSTVHMMYRDMISQSDGSALSAFLMLKDIFQRNSSSANRMEPAVAAQKSTPANHPSQMPLCVSSGPRMSSIIVEAPGSTWLTGLPSPS